MKKSALALSTLALACGPASAQSSVTLYGRIDLGLVVDSGAPAVGKSIRISSGAGSASRLGFRGVEDLGGGYKAGFQLETGVCADSAAGATPNFCTGSNFMGRQAHGDLSGPFGALVAGRQYSLGFDDLILTDPFSTGYAGRINNLVDGSGTRLNNSLRYTTPTLYGIKAAGEIGLGEQTGNWQKARSVGAEVNYTSKTIYANVIVDEAKNANGVDAARRNLQVSGAYDFQIVKVFALYQKGHGNPTGAPLVKTADWMAGVNVPLVGGNAFGSYVHHDDQGVLNHDAHQFGIGYNYPLSKRTAVYTAFAHIANENGAAFVVGNSTETGVGNKSFNLGVIHNF